MEPARYCSPAPTSSSSASRGSATCLTPSDLQWRGQRVRHGSSVAAHIRSRRVRDGTIYVPDRRGLVAVRWTATTCGRSGARAPPRSPRSSPVPPSQRSAMVFVSARPTQGPCTIAHRWGRARTLPRRPPAVVASLSPRTDASRPSAHSRRSGWIVADVGVATMRTVPPRHRSALQPPIPRCR